MKITLIVSGSIAAFKACALTSALVKEGHEVQCVASEGALRFVGAASLEGLSGKAVLSDLWENGRAMAHIELRRWSDLFVFYPASANRINQLAAGISSDLIGSIFLANNLEKPFWIAPAMNANMLAHPATQASLDKLAGWGYRIIHGNAGSLACGDIGSGRLAEPEQMLDLIRAESALQSRRALGEKRKLLVSGGAMDVTIDGVRSIRNKSSGKTASAIAGAFLKKGWQVEYLHHVSAELDGSAGAVLKSYREYGDFSVAMNGILAAGEYDAIIHAAAVSDYSIAENRDGKAGDAGLGRNGKIESNTPFTLHLVPNAKIINSLRTKAKGHPVIVGFKLTTAENEAAGRIKARKSLDENLADLVVWNDMSSIRRPESTDPVRSEERHDFVVFGPEAEAVGRGQTTAELAETLFREVDRLSSGRLPDGSSSAGRLPPDRLETAKSRQKTSSGARS